MARKTPLTAEEREEKNRIQREWRKANRDKQSQYARNYRAKYPDRVRATKNAWNAKAENRAKKKAYDQAYYLRNRDWILLRNSLYNITRPEWFRNYKSRWARENQDKVKASSKRYQLKNRERILARVKISTYKRRNAPGELFLEDIADLQEMSDGICAYCFCDLETVVEHVDHIQPLARNGRNEVENCVMACKSCNETKNDKTPLEFVFGVNVGHRKNRRKRVKT